MATALTLPPDPLPTDSKVLSKGPQTPDGASPFYASDGSPAPQHSYAKSSPAQSQTISPPSPTLVITKAPPNTSSTTTNVATSTAYSTITPPIITPTATHVPVRAHIHPPTWEGTTPLEWEIYQEQLRKHAAAEETKRREEAAATYYARQASIQEALLSQLQADLQKKLDLIGAANEELEQFRHDLGESIKQQLPSSSSVQKSSALRMQEEQEKKRLLAEWRHNNSDEPVFQLRKKILTLQTEVQSLNTSINQTKKELVRLNHLGGISASSTQIMREERKKREEMATKGIERPKAEPKPKQPPPAPVPKSHQQRMAEQQALKAKLRAARANPNLASASSSSLPSASSSVCSASN